MHYRDNTDYTFNIVQTHKNRLDYFQVVSALTVLKLKIIIGLFSTKNWYNARKSKEIYEKLWKKTASLIFSENSTIGRNPFLSNSYDGNNHQSGLVLFYQW